MWDTHLVHRISASDLHANLSLVFRSFPTSSQRLKNNNNDVFYDVSCTVKRETGLFGYGIVC